MNVVVTLATFGAAGIALLLFIRMRVRVLDPGGDGKEKPMITLTIDRPRDASIALAGRPVTFTARTDPLDRAHLIRWEVTNRPNAVGSGPSFTYLWNGTGVQQVVAHLDADGLTCGVIAYVFKTRSGGSTVRDLLDSEPPSIARDVGSFTPYKTTASAPARVS